MPAQHHVVMCEKGGSVCESFSNFWRWGTLAGGRRLMCSAGGSKKVR